MAHVGITDKKRRPFIVPEYRVSGVLPEYFQESYPKLITFLEKYYDWDTSSASPSHYLEHLAAIKDIVDVDEDLLQYIEDELLLGQSYFQGFRDRRTAALFAHILYKSKGTKFSIQQFFRMFYNTDADVVYTKEYMFLLNDSASFIGPTSQRYLVDDKLYQTYALLIKIGFSSSDWRDLYKLFVHPAGFYLGAEVSIVSDFNLDIDNMPTATQADILPYAVDGNAFVTFTPSLEATGVLRYDSDGSVGRIRVNFNSKDYEMSSYEDSSWTVQTLSDQYSDLREIMQSTSPQLDEDHDVDSSGIGFSNTRETMSQDQNYWWDSDSDGYVLQLSDRS